MFRVSGSLIVCLAVVGALSSQALGSFHFMQIEQVIGGVNGDTTAQAIQLRMRSSLQNQMQLSRLIAHDSTGGGNIVLATFPGPVANSATGSRVLIMSSAFAQYTNPSATADRIMSALIPASYLAAGSLTFEDNFGTIYWRLSWGGAGYTGSNAGSITNDGDGNFGPPVAGPLPSTTRQALKFNGSATAQSTNNLADYSVTGGDAIFNNNAGSPNFNVVTPACSTCSGDVNGDLHVDGADIAKIVDAYVHNTAGTIGGVCADPNHNGTIEDSEINSLVDIMLGNTAPSPPCN